MQYGWIKDVPDSRDFSAKDLIFAAPALPSKFIVDPGTVIYNQGSAPACVGFSSAGVKTDQEFVQGRSRITIVEYFLRNKL
ncbi:MAG: hypothetical protein V1767_01000 [Chloroflexota bacterium]